MDNILNRNQKQGISFLLISKLFERLAFYLVISILINELQGFWENDNTKIGLFYSIFYGSIGITSIFSGLLGDLTNRMKIAKIGMFSITLAYFLIIFSPSSFGLFYSILILLGVSIGLSVTNTIVLLGNIFNEQNNQTKGLIGFILFSLVIDIGVFFSPILSSVLQTSLEIIYIYILAFVFSIAALVFFLIFEKRYKSINLVSEQKSDNDRYRSLNITILISIIFIGVILKFLLGQRTLTFYFYLRDFVDNAIKQDELNQSGDLYSIIFLTIFSIIFILFKRISWVKVLRYVLLGSIISGLAYGTFLLIDFSAVNKNLARILFWSLIISETLIYPTLLYIVYRSSPKKYKGLFQGISLLLANQLIFLGAILYEETNPKVTFIVFSLIFILCSCLIYGLIRFVTRKEAGIKEFQ